METKTEREFYLDYELERERDAARQREQEDAEQREARRRLVREHEWRNVAHAIRIEDPERWLDW